MKQHKSFRQYLAEHNVKIVDESSNVRSINEAVMGQAKQFWPNFSIVDIMKISYFSDDWTSRSIFGKLTGKFSAKQVERLENGSKKLQSADHEFEIKYKERDQLQHVGSTVKLPIDTEHMAINYQGDDWQKVDDLIKLAISGKEKMFSYDKPTVKVPPPESYSQPEFGFVKDLDKKYMTEAGKTTSASFKVLRRPECPDDVANDVFSKIETTVKALGKAAKPHRVKPTGMIDLTVEGTIIDLFLAFKTLTGGNGVESFPDFFMQASPNMLEQASKPVQTFQNITGIGLAGSHLTDDDLKEISQFQKQFDFSSDLGVTQKWLLNFAYNSIYKKHKKLSPADIDAKVKAAEAAGTPISPAEIEKMKCQQMTKAEVEELAAKEAWSADKTKAVIASLPNPEFANVDDFCKEFKKNHIEQQIGNFNEIWAKQSAAATAAQNAFIELVQAARDAKAEWVVDKDGNEIVELADIDTKEGKQKLKAKLDSIVKSVENEWAVKQRLPEVKSLWQLQSLIDWHGTAEEIAAKAVKVKEIVQSKPVHGTKGSERRMKLFLAAKHLDPNTEIIQTSDWVVAVVRSAKATAPFGRLKPKVVKGTNDVDPKCNLEDWEGIDEASKKWRDTPSMNASDYVKDGVTDEHGVNFDTILGEHGQVGVKNAHIFCETAWCFTGVLGGQWGWSAIKGSSDFNNYTEHGKRPILIFMDTKRGALYAYAHFVSSDQAIENFLNENEKCDGDPKNGSDPSSARQMEFIDKFRNTHNSFAALLAQLNRKYYPDLIDDDDLESELEYDDYAPGEVKNSVAVSGAHPAAIRRLKLFKAAEHYGAKILRTPKWIVAICSDNQVHPFARYKPIASKDDPSKPDPTYNIEDWEMDELGWPESKKKEIRAIRDRIDYQACKKYDCVQDGITDGYGTSFNHLKARSGQKECIKYGESCWCVCGGLRPSLPWTDDNKVFYQGFGGYADGSQKKAFIFMEMSRGAMYLWTVRSDGSDAIANEQDSMDGYEYANHEKGQRDRFNEKILPGKPELKVLMDRLRKKYCKGGVKVSSGVSPEDLLKKAEQAGMISPNGALVLSSGNDAYVYRPIFNKFKRIVVTFKDCQSIFANQDLSNVRQIDFSGLAENLCDAFYDAKLDIIDIIGTQNVKNFENCFKGARLETLTGINTRRAKTICSMFSGAYTTKNVKLSIPELDLSECSGMDFAFTGTNIVNIKLKNTGNVEHAVDCYTKCPYLANYPQTMFPKITKIGDLASGEAFIDIFDGCDQLMNKSLATGGSPEDFDDLLERTERYYTNKAAELEAADRAAAEKAAELEAAKQTAAADAARKANALRYDDDGYYKITGANSAKCQYFEDHAPKIDKIRIYTDATENIFNNVNLYAKEIDLNGTSNAFSMFRSARFRRIPTLTGCEHVKDASFMFTGCDFAIPPTLNLPAVEKFQDIFTACNNMHQLPKMKIGRAFTDGLEQFDDAKYVFGQDYAAGGAAEKCGTERLKTFCRNLRGQIIDGIELPGVKTGEGGAKSIEPKTSEILAKFDSVRKFIDIAKYVGKGNMPKKIIVDTDPAGLFQDCVSLDLAVEFDQDAMASHSATWQPRQMFKKASIKSLKLLNWPQSFTDISEMFQNAQCECSIPAFDMSNITMASDAFNGCHIANTADKMLPALPSLKCGQGMFAFCNALPATLKISEMKLGNSLTNAIEMFNNNPSVITVDWLVCDNLQLARSMFGQSGVVLVNKVKLKNADCTGMFKNCKLLESVKAFSCGGDADDAFNGCKQLSQVNYIDIPNHSSICRMFKGCNSFAWLLWYNFNKASESTDMFDGTPIGGLFGVNMEKYKSSKYVQKIPDKIKNVFSSMAAE